MNRVRTLLAIVIVLLVVGAGVAVANDSNKTNDRVLHDNSPAYTVKEKGGYGEVFKQEGKGDKNYLYTVTEFEDRWGRQCTAVSGDSEKTIALDCDLPPQG